MTFYRRLPQFDYLKPRTIEETIALLVKHGEKAQVIAGGTDLIPWLKKREKTAGNCVIDLKGLRELEGFTCSEERGLTIGALTTAAAIEVSAQVRALFPVLAQAAASMASPQVRNRATFVGNICSAVPSADSAPALLALNAQVRLRGAGGERLVPLDKFFTGPRQTVVGREEIVTAIEVPKMPAGSKGVYLKLSPRHSMDLAVVGVSVVAACDKGVCKEIRIALGAVAPTPVRAPMAESILHGQKITSGLIDEAANNAITQCSPIDDHRASREYRCDMVYVMTRRALRQVLLGGDE